MAAVVVRFRGRLVVDEMDEIRLMCANVQNHHGNLERGGGGVQAIPYGI